MRGLMQDVALTTALVLDRAETVAAGTSVVSVDDNGTHVFTWGDVARRARQVAVLLGELGVAPGAVVGSLAWNTHRHLELYLGVPASGRVLHTINARLFRDDLRYVIEHANDRVVFVDASLTPTLAELADELGDRTVVVLGDGAPVHPAFADAPAFDALLAGLDPMEELPVLDERDAASVCFTSGTTGRPKAVVYSHRSVLLHALGALGVDSHAISRRDVVLPLTPMFHVNCWGLPYTAALAGAGLVLAGRDTGPEAVATLLRDHRPTVLAGVPTFLVRLLRDVAPEELGSLRHVLCGGAEASPTLVDAFRDRGIAFFHAWGATELSPSGTGAWLRPGHDDDARWGAPLPGVQLRLRADDGTLAPWDGATVGELEARGPWVIGAYLDAASDAFADDGWFRTGDVARMDPDGTMEVVDRAKDLVKSGGEWIPSLALERAIAALPGVDDVAVVAVPHPEWGERPAALVVGDIDPDALRADLAERVARWWVPEQIRLVDALPKTGVGKHDKQRIRRELAEEGRT